MGHHPGPDHGVPHADEVPQDPPLGPSFWLRVLVNWWCFKFFFVSSPRRDPLLWLVNPFS
jgi:hypothetical protein